MVQYLVSYPALERKNLPAIIIFTESLTLMMLRKLDILCLLLSVW